MGKLKQQRDDLKAAVQMQQEMYDALQRDTDPKVIQVWMGGVDGKA